MKRDILRKRHLEHIDDFNAWIDTANTPLTDKELCTMQDIFGRSSALDLITMQADLARETPHRTGLMFFCIGKIMGQDAAIDSINRHAKRQALNMAGDEIAQYDRETQAERDRLDDRKKELDRQHKEIMRQRDDLAAARRAIGWRFKKQQTALAEAERKAEFWKKEAQRHNEQKHAERAETRKARKLIKAMRILAAAITEETPDHE